MNEHLGNEVVTTYTLPTGPTPELVLKGTDRRKSLAFNLMEVTTGPLSFLVTADAAPASAAEMYQYPIGGIIQKDATGTSPGDVYLLAPAGVGTVKLVETD